MVLSKKWEFLHHKCRVLPRRPRFVCLKGKQILMTAMFPLVMVTAPADAVSFSCGWNIY
jgi:hypothetical protein